MCLENLDNIPIVGVLPLGYAIRTYRKGDDPEWIRIIQEAFGENLAEAPEVTLKNILIKPDFEIQSLFFATCKDNPIGTACAVTLLSGNVKTGYLHMVAVSPQHQGKKIGRALTVAALKFFKEKGIRRVILDTDDFRIQAIKTYRNIGFKPVYFDQNHKKRWAKILKAI